MMYKASLFATGFFGHILCFLLFVFLIILILVDELLLAVLLICVGLTALIRLKKRKLSFENGMIHYNGWFKTVTVPVHEILKIENSEKLGYPYNRLHGPLEYRVVTKKEEVWVSLLFFNSAAATEFQKLRKIVKKKKK